MRKTILAALAMSAALAAPIAHADSGVAFGGFGHFATTGSATAAAFGTGRVESFGDSSAASFTTRADGTTTASGWTRNTAGVISEGNAAGFGDARGFSRGGEITVGGFGRRR